MRRGSRKFFFLSFRSLFFDFLFDFRSHGAAGDGWVTVCLSPLSDVLARVGLAISGVGMASSRVGIDGSGITLHIAGIILHSSRPEMLS